MTQSAYLFGIDLETSYDDPAPTPEVWPEPESVEELPDEIALDEANESEPLLLASPLDGVNDEAWTEFAVALRTAAPWAVSASNGLGAWEMKARRLADLGLVDPKSLSCKRSPAGRMAWVGKFVAPLTQKKFLDNAKLQYETFVRSMQDYVSKIDSGEIGCEDDTMTLSGALAVLHRCGPRGLERWQNESKRFSDTLALFERANEVF